MCNKPRGDIDHYPVTGIIKYNATHRALDTKIDAWQKRKGRLFANSRRILRA